MTEVTSEYSEAERLVLRLIYGPMMDKAARVSVPAAINFSHAVTAVEAALTTTHAQAAELRAEVERLREKWNVTGILLEAALNEYQATDGSHADEGHWSNMAERVIADKIAYFFANPTLKATSHD